jgi:hypothetical protein
MPVTVVACIAVVCLLVVNCELDGTIPMRLPTGESGYVVRDISNLGSTRGPCVGVDEYALYAKSWDDCISSVRIAPGWNARLYEHAGFGGRGQVVLEDVPNLRDVRGPCQRTFDDCVSSIRVFRQE